MYGIYFAYLPLSSWEMCKVLTKYCATNHRTVYTLMILRVGAGMYGGLYFVLLHVHFTYDGENYHIGVPITVTEQDIIKKLEKQLEDWETKDKLKQQAKQKNRNFLVE